MILGGMFLTTVASIQTTAFLTTLMLVENIAEEPFADVSSFISPWTERREETNGGGHGTIQPLNTLVQ